MPCKHRSLSFPSLQSHALLSVAPLCRRRRSQPQSILLNAPLSYASKICSARFHRPFSSLFQSPASRWDSVAYGWYVEDASHPLAVRFPRTYLAVPIEEKDIVKSGGAKWDPAVKGWWVDSPTHPLATQYPRVYIDVSLAEKEAAKTGGAKWDPIARRWYVGSTDHPLAKAYGPISTFATEDRTFGGPLGMEVIPRGYWARSVRTLVTEENFRRIQRTVLGRTDCCELCGAAARGRKLEVHSRWDVNGIACRIRLARLLAACPNCMDVVNLVRKDIARYHEMSHDLLVREP